MQQHVRTHTRDGGGAYLLLDGSRPMTGNLDMGLNGIILSQDVILKRFDNNTVELKDLTDTTRKKLRLLDVFTTSINAAGTTLIIQPTASTSSKISIRARKTGSFVEAVLIQSNPTAPYVEFPIGDQRMPSLPTSDPADGNSKLWSNSGVVTVGT